MNVIELFRRTCLSMVWLIIFTGLKAQTIPPSLDKQVHVPSKEVNIATLGDIITAQTGLILSFNAQKIIAQKQLWLPQPSYSIHQLLSMVKKATGAEYTIYREHIIFRKSNHNAATQTVTASQAERQVGSPVVTQLPHAQTGFKLLKTQVTKLPGNMVQHHTPAQPVHLRTKMSILPGSHKGHEDAIRTAKSSNDGNTTQQDTAATNRPNAGTGIAKVISGTTDNTLGNIANDSTTADKQQPYLLSYLTSAVITITPVKPANPTLLTVHPTMQQHRQRRYYEKPGLFKPFVNTGFAADEVLYANFQARAGVTLLYGIAAWSTNFSVSGFRYGAGSSYPLKNGWLIQLEATTGKFSKVTPIFMDDTATVKRPLTSDSRLQRISLFAKKNIASHLSVYAGPVFNHLKSSYRTIVEQVSPATISLRRFATEREYVTIRPPYTLSASPSEELENVKTWIGLQVGIDYRF